MVLLVLALACAPKHDGAPVAASAAAPVAAPLAALPDGTLPRPFTAQQLHDALPAGASIVLVVAAAGQPPAERRLTFTEPTDTTTTVVAEVWAGGQRVGEPERESVAWAELVEHAAFPAAATTRADTTVDGPLGHFDAWLYTVTEAGDDGVPTVSRYWFARALPGPPVLLTVERQGVEVMRLTQVARTTGG